MTPPVAQAGMLIRRPVSEVFEAFVDPAVTIRFWFTAGSGRLEPGATVRWEWAMYGAGTDVRVKAIEPDQSIRIEWDLNDNPTEVAWTFEARGDHTWVQVENRGFHGDDDAQVSRALDSSGGFALVLAGSKIWLEHGIDPRFVLDRHPDHHLASWRSSQDISP